jgi:hypothetical protein
MPPFVCQNSNSNLIKRTKNLQKFNSCLQVAKAIRGRQLEDYTTSYRD